MSSEKWQKVILGIIIGLGTYGEVKWIRKEKWTWQGAAGSATVGGIGFPFAEPGIRKIIDKLKNLPPPPPYIPPRSGGDVLTSFPDDKKRLLVDELTELQDKLSRISRESVVKVPASQPENNWYSILIPESVILIIGKRGSGKSALDYFLLEKLLYRMDCYVVGLPKTVRHLLPPRIGVAPTLENAPFNATLLVDETPL